MKKYILIIITFIISFTVVSAQSFEKEKRTDVKRFIAKYNYQKIFAYKKSEHPSVTGFKGGFHYDNNIFVFASISEKRKRIICTFHDENGPNLGSIKKEVWFNKVKNPINAFANVALGKVDGDRMVFIPIDGKKPEGKHYYFNLDKWNSDSDIKKIDYAVIPKELLKSRKGRERRDGYYNFTQTIMLYSSQFFVKEKRFMVYQKENLDIELYSEMKLSQIFGYKKPVSTNQPSTPQKNKEKPTPSKIKLIKYDAWDYGKGENGKPSFGLTKPIQTNDKGQRVVRLICSVNESIIKKAIEAYPNTVTAELEIWDRKKNYGSGGVLKKGSFNIKVANRGDSQVLLLSLID